jgi:SpoVK/Ycf46/Vps4 family AAA+-type ATPase
MKTKYAFDFEKLHRIIPSLENLFQTIGMESIKKNIINQIIYFLLGLESKHGMMNTVIYGPPGIGKTLVGHIIGEIYNKLGLVANSDSNKIVKLKTYKASMLIGEYLGHTRKRTKDAINECLKTGSVMFLDEAYALSSGGSKSDKGDSYAYESIDELNIALSENPNFILIIAGYEDDLEKRFFAINKGLDRRFPFRYKIDKYDYVELSKIFLKKIKDDDWKFEESSDKLAEFFKKNIKSFPAFGGSVDELFFNVKINHGLRIFGKKPEKRKHITMEDVSEGFQLYKKVKNIKEDDERSIYNMYT